MERRSLIIVMLMLAGMGASQVKAQNDDFGMWYEVSAEKKLSKKWSVGVEAEFRTRDNSKTADRWSAGLTAEYKLAKGTIGSMPASLKASAGYNLLYDNNAEELTFKSSSALPKKWTPGYWGVRHRFNVSLSGSVDVGRLSVSLRERWQYTYRPSSADKKYAFVYDADDNLSGYELEPVKGKGKNVLRSRLQLDYNIPNCKVDPFVNAEMFNGSGGIQKLRYQIGAEYKIQKRHVLSLTYRFQTVNSSDDDNETDRHLLGLGYKFKF